MRLIIYALVLLLAVVLTVQNTQVVDVSLLFWRPRASLAIVIALCLLLGLLLGLASLAPLIFRERRSARRLETRLADLEAERHQPTSARPESSFDTPMAVDRGPRAGEMRRGPGQQDH